MSGPTHFYVWYTVRGELANAMEKVSGLMSAVEARTGIAGRVLARRDDASTWMEIYEGVDDAARFERVLSELAREHDALSFIEDGRRHTERFAALTDALQ
ncbi:MAG TPA: DUF4936 family protein [Casimicrobiaceae bacterium]|nr:DUF4936 family protein [Casimicrobiaceae bacterium]